jgi:hypothetical protein
MAPFVPRGGRGGAPRGRGGPPSRGGRGGGFGDRGKFATRALSNLFPGTNPREERAILYVTVCANFSA